MPSAKDRAKLEEEIARGRAERHRIRIWDYFFRPNPDDVGQSIREELSELRAQVSNRVAEGTQRLEHSLDALAQLERTRQREIAEANAQLHAIETQTAARENARAQSSINLGSLLGAGSFVVGFVLLVVSNNANGVLERFGAGCFFAGWFMVGLPVMLIGLGMVLSGQRKRAPETILALVAAQQKETLDRWAQREAVLNGETEKHRAGEAAAREILERLVPHLRSQIATLEQSLRALIAQIPKAPAAEEVQEWLRKDIDALLEKGAEVFGVVGQTVKIGDKDYFVIQGPAEIQDQRLIPSTYINDEDRNKYLHARQFGRIRGGRTYQHYGLFSLEVLYVTGAVLARYSVLFDFIRGIRVRESAPQQHFADVVMLEMRKEDRQIRKEGILTYLERVPSMILALSSGDQVSITLATDEYFDAVEALDAASNEALETADKALRVITHYVNEAKKRLEVTELARMKEAERRT